jgi:hypothetical protein|tara:strand:+ start:175 stop:348 length:174 start_codon:yes stop_codon:yes gene_type:complete
MNILKSIILQGQDEDYQVDTPIVKTKSFVSAERKFKGKEVIGMLKISEDEIMVFVSE